MNCRGSDGVILQFIGSERDFQFQPENRLWNDFKSAVGYPLGYLVLGWNGLVLCGYYISLPIPDRALELWAYLCIRSASFVGGVGEW